MNNPVVKDLIKLKLIKKKNFELISKKVRNGNTDVYRDKFTKVIFLKKNLITKNYYKNRYEKFNIKNNKFSKFTFEKINNRYIKLKTINDDLRRYLYLKKYLTKKKNILDYGCGKLNFLNILKKKKINPNQIFGLEKNEIILNKSKSDKSFILKNNLDNFRMKFDVVTMFHVLHYLPDQISALKEIFNKLNKNGKIFIEVPNAQDILFNLKTFTDFTLCKESLVWHTEDSIKKFLNQAGFRKIKLRYIQRFGLSNHLYWLIQGRPGGHSKFKNLYDERMELMYIKQLIKNKSTDTLWVEGIK